MTDLNHIRNFCIIAHTDHGNHEVSVSERRVYVESD